MQLAAGAYRYRPLKQGLTGWDCWALQEALSMFRDGVFGPITDAEVKRFQANHGLVLDGVAGVLTQRELTLDRIIPLQKALAMPAGLIRGMVEGESGFLIGNYTAPYPNGTRDVGLCMFNLSPTDSNLKFAFDGKVAITEMSSRLLTQQKKYLAQAGVRGDNRISWRYAVLSHNWPVAADHYAANTVSSWRYKSRGIWYGMGDPAPWIKEIGVLGVSTGYDWSKHYVDSKLAYCPTLR